MSSLSYSSIYQRACKASTSSCRSQPTTRVGSRTSAASFQDRHASMSHANVRAAIACLRDGDSDEEDLIRAEKLLGESKRAGKRAKEYMTVSASFSPATPKIPDSSKRIGPGDASNSLSYGSSGDRRWISGGASNKEDKLSAWGIWRDDDSDLEAGGSESSLEDSPHGMAGTEQTKCGQTQSYLDIEDDQNVVKTALVLEGWESGWEDALSHALTRSDATMSTSLAKSAEMVGYQGRHKMLLRLAVTKERRALACRTLYQWMRTSWKSLRDSSRAVATMGATRRWMQAGMARGRQGNLWAAPARRPVLTLAQLLRLRKETMEKLAWLVLIHRRTVLVSYLQTWRGKLASWRLLRSFLPNALSNLTASKASKRNEAVRPMWRVWEVAGSALLHRMWLDRALKSAMAVFRHHTSRCKLLRRSFGRLRNKRRVALSKDTLETWRLGIASAQTMQTLERLLSRERVRRNRRVALQAMMGWRCVGQMQQRLRRLSCLVQARAARREMKGFISGWSSLARWVRQQCDHHTRRLMHAGQNLVCVSFWAWLDAASCCKHARRRSACFLRRLQLRSCLKAFQCWQIRLASHTRVRKICARKAARDVHSRLLRTLHAMRKAKDDSRRERALESKVDARRGLLVQHRAFSCLISTLQTLRNTRGLASRLEYSNRLRLQQHSVRTWAGGVQMLSAQRCRVLRMQLWRARRACLGLMRRWSFQAWLEDYTKKCYRHFFAKSAGALSLETRLRRPWCLLEEMEELLRNEASAASEARASVELVASISLQTSRRPLAAGNRVGQNPQGGGKPSLSPCPAPCACLCRSSMPQAGGSATRSKCGPKRQVGRPRAASRHQDVSQGHAKGLAAIMSTAMERSNKAILRANSTFKTGGRSGFMKNIGGETCWKDNPRGQRCQSDASHDAPDRNLESGNDYETCDDYQTCHGTSSGEG